MILRPPRSTLFPTRRSSDLHPALPLEYQIALTLKTACGFSTSEIARGFLTPQTTIAQRLVRAKRDRKSTRLNSSHSQISYAVFCLKKKKKKNSRQKLIQQET